MTTIAALGPVGLLLLFLAPGKASNADKIVVNNGVLVKLGCHCCGCGLILWLSHKHTLTLNLQCGHCLCWHLCLPSIQNNFWTGL